VAGGVRSRPLAAAARSADPSTGGRYSEASTEGVGTAGPEAESSAALTGASPTEPPVDKSTGAATTVSVAEVIGAEKLSPGAASTSGALA